MTKQNMTRRSFLKRLLGWFTGTIATIAGGYSYATYIEPHWLETKRLTLSFPTLPTAFHQLKVVVFSDTHIGHHYDANQFEKLINAMNKEKADLIIFAGDLLDRPMSYQDPERLIAILTKLRARFGKFAVYGNHDHGDYGTDLYRTVIENAGFQLLRNEAATITSQSETIVIAGLDDQMLGKPDVDATLSSVQQEQWSLLIAHEPDIADDIHETSVNLQISGHTHGGQVQLPFFGPLVLPPLGEKYIEGLYTFTDTDFQLYVNRGIGTTRLPYRFLARPELTVLTLERT
ncbi:metallophosphoesterase [Bacillaceae bacterium SIJ1]|uniref:metallophosphoesterase n=1 Tax=Litoribacterium kuwaitense TaxID=1398745 RepID=UPI0013ED175F|nr:metallophosphoesterase [Litoribacterium kuwaitense]NGP44419.1 metallophosphoesterase [Litoribacterium kuwaitense]